MTVPQRIVNLLQSAGPPSELAELLLRLGKSVPGGAPKISGGELAQRISGVLATGNVSALPRPMDATIGKMAKKLLRGAGVPTNEYMVFELSRLLRANILNGQDLIDNRVISYLSYRRRTHAIHDPIAQTSEWLWQESRRVMADF
jgi:hypothetical protein